MVVALALALAVAKTTTNSAGMYTLRLGYYTAAQMAGTWPFTMEFPIFSRSALMTTKPFSAFCTSFSVCWCGASVSASGGASVSASASASASAMSCDDSGKS